MYSDAILQLEQARANEWARCGCTITCRRIKRRKQTNEGGPDTTRASIGTERVRRYSNDIKEEQITTSSNARHGATTQGVTFKPPKKAREEGCIEGQPKDKILAKDKDKDIEIQSKHENGANQKNKGK